MRFSLGAPRGRDDLDVKDRHERHGSPRSRPGASSNEITWVQTCLARLHERLTFASKPALETLDALGQQLQQLMHITHTQGLVMAFADVFFLLMLLFVALAALAIIIKKPPGVHGA